MNTMLKFTSGVSCACAVLCFGALIPPAASGQDRSAVVEPSEQPETPPADGQGWRARGDELREAGEPELALEAYRKAEQLGAGDEELVMTIAQIYRELGRDRDAFREFTRNRHAVNPELRASACYGMNDLNWAKYKVLPDPYFLELGAYGGWQSVNDLSYFATPMRLGIMQGTTRPTSYYLFAKIGRDNRTGWVGPSLQQYSDNLGVFGGGVQQLLVPKLGLKAVGEVGWSYDLVRLDRDRSRADVRAGLELWAEWYTSRLCDSLDRYPFRFLMTAWGELMYYSRYADATVFGADLRPGVRVRETDQGAVDVLGIFGFFFDSKAMGSFQYGEAGVAVRWIPDHQSPFRISLRAVQTFNNDGRTGAKYGIELEHYFYW